MRNETSAKPDEDRARAVAIITDDEWCAGAGADASMARNRKPSLRRRREGVRGETPPRSYYIHDIR